MRRTQFQRPARRLSLRLSALLIALSLAACTGDPAGPVGDGNSKAFEARELFSGDAASFEPGELLITDEAAFEEYWNRLRGGVDDLPQIDFSTHVVVSYHMGARLSGGFEAQFRRYELTGEELAIRVVERLPASDCLVPTYISSPTRVMALRVRARVARFDVAEATISCE
jgi:hypothetical protein